MTTATNIQIADHGSTGKKDNDKETVIMKIQSNVQGIIQNNAKVMAGIMVGGFIAAASIFPGNASADSPARPHAEVPSASSISSTGLHYPEVDDWVSLTYSEKLVPANAFGAFDYPEVDDWVSLTYSEKLVPANNIGAFNFPEVDDWVSLAYSEKQVPANNIGAFDFPEVDDWVSLTYSEKLVPANAFGAFDFPEVDDWVALTYTEKLVANFDYPETLILNDNFSMIYGTPDTGLELSRVSYSTPARVEVYPESLILNDNFSMAY